MVTDIENQIDKQLQDRLNQEEVATAPLAKELESARLSCAYVGLDSRGLEELPLEPERRKEAKYQQQPRRLGRSAPVPRLPARPRAHDGGPGPPAPPRALADAGLTNYSPRPELRLPGAEEPRD
ncbi:unnamed protein product [Rangifer tarandus platyrhynchus]|uniref:Uncharacterized protein n=1 Tax=Rangifer tarandus platyrhynchus TaxID=3082113 RepID=A0AC59Y0V1_RANTA